MEIYYYFAFEPISVTANPLVKDWTGKVYVSNVDPQDPGNLTSILNSLKIQQGMMEFMSVNPVTTLPDTPQNEETIQFLTKTGRIILALIE